MHSMPGPSFGLRSNLSNHMRSSEDTLPHAILVSHFLMTAVHCRQRHHWKKTWPSKYRKDIEKNACLTAVLIDCRFITYRTYCVYCITESYLSPLYKTSQRPSLLYPFDCCFPTIPRSWKSLGIVQPQKIPEMSSCCSGVSACQGMQSATHRRQTSWISWLKRGGRCSLVMGTEENSSAAWDCLKMENYDLNSMGENNWPATQHIPKKDPKKEVESSTLGKCSFKKP